MRSKSPSHPRALKHSPAPPVCSIHTHTHTLAHAHAASCNHGNSSLRYLRLTIWCHCDPGSLFHSFFGHCRASGYTDLCCCYTFLSLLFFYTSYYGFIQCLTNVLGICQTCQANNKVNQQNIFIQVIVPKFNFSEVRNQLCVTFN